MRVFGGCALMTQNLAPGILITPVTPATLAWPETAYG